MKYCVIIMAVSDQCSNVRLQNRIFDNNDFVDSNTFLKCNIIIKLYVYDFVTNIMFE